MTLFPLSRLDDQELKNQVDSLKKAGKLFVVDHEALKVRQFASQKRGKHTNIFLILDVSASTLLVVCS